MDGRNGSELVCFCWCATHFELIARRTIVGAVVGAWLGALVIPLDWDRWWQRYPLPNFAGSVCGWVLGAISAELHWNLRRLKIEKLP
nr:GPI biosynthesis protein Pig-F domain containing protein [Haemonchus contortus]